MTRWTILFLAFSCSSPAPTKDGGPASEPPEEATSSLFGEDPDPPEPDPPCTPAAPVVLNEVAPSNREVLTDLAGDSVDWIEIANAARVPVDLAGWTLSDDPDEPRKWPFPPLVLAPGELLLVYASGKGGDRPVATWDTRIDLGDPWRYHAVTGPVEGWTEPDFDDSAWPSGPSGFGHGDGDDATEVETHTVYARTTFELTEADVADLVALVLHVDFDDGFVAFLDGVEVARANLEGAPPAWDEWATSAEDAVLPEGLTPAEFDLTDEIARLGAGPHTLAVEVHDLKADSTDLSLVPILTFGFATVREGRASQVIDFSGRVHHTNFELRAEGERVRLFDPAGCEVDEVEPEPLLADESYGRQPDGTGPWLYFLEPTPGAPNATEGRPGFSATPELDPPGGFHPGGIALTASGAPGATLRYTLDGREPTEDDPEVTGPIDAAGAEAVVVRVRAFEDGLWPSRIATTTVLDRAPGTLPVVSLVTDPVNLWDEETGIYVFGPEDYETEPPFRGANFWEDWERPVHVEMWEADTSAAFAVSGGIKIHGGNSRANDQKALAIELDAGWGDGEIPYAIFPDLGISSYDRVLLRAAGNDNYGCSPVDCDDGAHLRDGFMHRLTAGAEIDAMAYRPVEVYLNGAWWGLYELREEPDLSYVIAHHGVEDIDLLTYDGNPKHGDAVAWNDLLNDLRTSDLADPAVWAGVEARIDVEELANYLAFEIFFANTDWPGNNVKWWRPRAADGRWRWLLCDLDFGAGAWGRNPDHDTLAMALEDEGTGHPNPPWSTELFRLLVQSPTFVTRFANTYADLMNTNLHPDVTRATLAELAGGIAADMPRQRERWGFWTDGVTSREIAEGAWEVEIAWIDEWLGERPEHARAQVVAQFGLGGTFPLALEADPPGAGTFRLETVEVEGPFEGTYFQDLPVTITAVPAPGYTFAGWSDPALPADPTIAITADDDAPVRLVARFE